MHLPYSMVREYMTYGNDMWTLNVGSGDLYLDGVSRSDVVAGLDVHEVAVLTQAHWDRIQYQLKKKEIEAEKIRKIIEAREQLHQLSLDRVKDWKNTVYVRNTAVHDLNSRLTSSDTQWQKSAVGISGINL